MAILPTSNKGLLEEIYEEEDLLKLKEEIDAADERYVRIINKNIRAGDLSGPILQPSKIKYDPQPILKIGPLPKYIPTIIKTPIEPKIQFGPCILHIYVRAYTKSNTYRGGDCVVS